MGKYLRREKYIRQSNKKLGAAFREIPAFTGVFFTSPVCGAFFMRCVMHPKYSEKLRDPRWQKMRLKVLERDEWTCQYCGDTESTLAIHHKYYIAGNEPWDYPLEALVTICANCHEAEYQDRPGAEQSLLKAFRAAGFMSYDLERMAAGIQQLLSDMFDRLKRPV